MQLNSRWALAGVLAVAGIAGGSAAAPLDGGFCSCNHQFEAGDVVHLLVDNPNRAENLPAGSEGKVLCGNPRFDKWVQVGFFDWDNGGRDLNHFCECGGIDSDGKGWWVRCNTLAPGPALRHGACCLGGHCVATFEPDCLNRGGEFLGRDIECMPDLCGCGEPVDCPDLDGNGVVDIQDAHEFIFQFFGWRPEPPQDLNADCEVDGLDLILILDAIGHCVEPIEEPPAEAAPQPDPDPTGACCTGDECRIATEAECNGEWLGEAVTCDDVDCRVRAFDDEPLCRCEGQFRAGDRVTLLVDNPGRTGAVQNGRPELLRGARGVVLCADASGWDRVTVAWEGFRDHAPDDPRDRLDPTWLCDCGVYRGNGLNELGIHVLETWIVDCENLLPGWREIDEVGACCLGDQCQPLPEADCLDRGGEWGGDRSPCSSETCAGEVLCHCDEQFAVGDEVELLVNAPLGHDDLPRGRHGYVICSWEHEEFGDLVLVRWWRASGNRTLVDQCECGWRDPIHRDRLQIVQCEHIRLRNE